MVIAKENTRVQVTVSNDVKEDLEKLAKKQNRKLSNLCSTVLKEYRDNEKEKGHL